MNFGPKKFSDRRDDEGIYEGDRVVSKARTIKFDGHVYHAPKSAMVGETLRIWYSITRKNPMASRMVYAGPGQKRAVLLAELTEVGEE